MDKAGVYIIWDMAEVFLVGILEFKGINKGGIEG